MPLLVAARTELAEHAVAVAVAALATALVRLRDELRQHELVHAGDLVGGRSAALDAARHRVVARRRIGEHRKEDVRVDVHRTALRKVAPVARAARGRRKVSLASCENRDKHNVAHHGS